MQKKTFKKHPQQLPVVIQADELGGYWVTCPTLPGCYSQGETIDEALENISEAITLCLAEISPANRVKFADRPVSLHLVTV